MNDKALDVKGVEKVYNQQTVLKDLHFSIKKGEWVFLTGANGSGKTTLLEILLGLTHPTNGEILFFNKRLKDNREEILRKIYFLSHETFFYHSLTVLENLEFSYKIFPKKEGLHTKNKKSFFQDLSKSVLEQVSLYFHRNKRVDQLSLGMRHRLSIARFLLWDSINQDEKNNEKILFLDEPYSGLDKRATSLLDELLDERANKGFTMVEATHRLGYVEEMWNKHQKSKSKKRAGFERSIRVLFLKDGAFLLDTSRDKVRKPLSEYLII